MVRRHIPHSLQWFDTLRQMDLTLAIHTARILQVSGRDDVCGECGETPALDYELQGAGLPDGTILTMRLCSICAVIRRGLGERWEPMKP